MIKNKKTKTNVYIIKNCISSFIHERKDAQWIKEHKLSLQNIVGW